MAHITKETIHATLPAILSNGQVIELKGTITKQSAYYKVDAVRAIIDDDNYPIAQAAVCKSSQDILILARLMTNANHMNEIMLQSLVASAEQWGISIDMLTRLLTRAVASDLFHKMGTGHYFVNPFLYMSKAAVGESNYKQQELVQARWRETTGLLSQSDIASLVSLSTFLGQAVTLPGTEFNLSVAYYYSKHKIITPKQITAYKKRGVIPANWSISDVNRSY